MNKFNVYEFVMVEDKWYIMFRPQFKVETKEELWSFIKWDTPQFMFKQNFFLMPSDVKIEDLANYKYEAYFTDSKGEKNLLGLVNSMEEIQNICNYYNKDNDAFYLGSRR